MINLGSLKEKVKNNPLLGENSISYGLIKIDEDCISSFYDESFNLDEQTELIEAIQSCIIGDIEVTF